MSMSAPRVRDRRRRLTLRHVSAKLWVILWIWPGVREPDPLRCQHRVRATCLVCHGRAPNLTEESGLWTRSDLMLWRRRSPQPARDGRR